MSVKDDGVGLPPELNFRNTTSLGMQLINIFVDQLEGSIKSVDGNGTNLEIVFPVASEMKSQ